MKIHRFTILCVGISIGIILNVAMTGARNRRAAAHAAPGPAQDEKSIRTAISIGQTLALRQLLSAYSEGGSHQFLFDVGDTDEGYAIWRSNKWDAVRAVQIVQSALHGANDLQIYAAPPSISQPKVQ